MEWRRKNLFEKNLDLKQSICTPSLASGDAKNRKNSGDENETKKFIREKPRSHRRSQTICTTSFASGDAKNRKNSGDENELKTLQSTIHISKGYETNTKDVYQNCPGNHGLKNFKITFNYTLHCDRCEKQVEKGGTIHSCRFCDFDLCPNCYENLIPVQNETAMKPKILSAEDTVKMNKVKKILSEQDTNIPLLLKSF